MTGTLYASPPPVLDLEAGSSARRPRRRRERPQSTPVALTLAPMIDMSFTFLIFFVVTTRFIQPEGILGSKMPRAAGSAAVPPSIALPVTPIVVRLSSAGAEGEECVIRIDTFPDAAPGDFNELAALLREIQQKPGFDAETPLVIAAQTDVRWDHVVGCWNAALRAECKNIAFAEP